MVARWAKTYSSTTSFKKITEGLFLEALDRAEVLCTNSVGSGNESSMDIEESSREQNRSSNANKGPRHECECDEGHCL